VLGACNFLSFGGCHTQAISNCSNLGALSISGGAKGSKGGRWQLNRRDSWRVELGLEQKQKVEDRPA